MYLHKPWNHADWFGHHLPAKGCLVAVDDEPVEKIKSVKFPARVMAVSDSGRMIPVSGKLLVYLQKDAKALAIKYGDVLWLQGNIDSVGKPPDKGMFDFAAYLRHRGIVHQVWAGHGKWILSGEQLINPVKAFSLKTRSRLIKILGGKHAGDSNHAVVSAILLGYDEYLDSDLRDDFAGAGAMHILCVSGLHVGIIYLLVAALLGFIRKNAVGKWVFAIVVLLSVWVYAVITGISPSVLRASVMISFVALSGPIGRKNVTYNVLAASAFLLLFINPSLLFYTGFRLSYLAVTAIVLLYSPIYKLLVVKNRLLDRIWALTVVGLAANIGTAPLAIYYFHQFPLLFFLTNLIVIPLTSVIVYLGIVVLAVQFWPAAASLAEYFLTQVTGFLIGYIRIINQIPFSTIDSLYLSPTGLLLIYLIIISAGIAIALRSRVWLRWMVVFMAAGVSLFTWRNVKLSGQLEANICSVPGHSALTFVSGRSGWMYADSDLANDQQKLKYYLSGHLIMQGVHWPVKLIDSGSNEGPWVHKTGENTWFGFGGIRLVSIREWPAGNDFRPMPVVDVLIVAGNHVQPQPALLTRKPLLIVVDRTVPYWLEKKWSSFCLENSVPFYSLRKSGMINLKIKKGGYRLTATPNSPNEKVITF